MYNTKIEQIRVFLETLVNRNRFAVSGNLPSSANFGDKCTEKDTGKEKYLYNDQWNEITVDNGD